MLETLYSLGTLLTMVLTAFGVGRPLLRLLKVGNEGVTAAIVWSIALGFVVAGWLMSLAAFASPLTPLCIGLLTIAGSFWGLGEVTCTYLTICNPLKANVAALEHLADRTQASPPSRRLRTAIIASFTFISLATLVAALAPPTSPTALVHSLELPKTVMLGGSIVGSNRPWPQFGGMLHAWALTLDGPVAATLLSWFFGMLLAAATALLARSMLGRSWGWCAGAIVCFAPGIAYQMSAPLDDLMMAAFVTLALAAWWRGAVELLSPRWFILAGLFLGAALATKAVAIVMLVAAAITWSVEAARHGEHRHEIALGAAKCVLIALIVACPWWAWVVARGGVLSPAEAGTSLVVQLGPWFLAIVPGLLVSRRLRGLHLLVWMTTCYLLASWLIAPQSRTFAPLVPLLATFSTWAYMELSRLPAFARRVAVASLTFTELILLAANLQPVSDRWRVAYGSQTRSAYLREHVGTYAAAEVANRLVHQDSRMLSEDGCGLYFNCPVVTHVEHVPQAASVNSNLLLRQICGEGFTHLLLCWPDGVANHSVEQSSLLRRAVEADLAKHDPQVVIPLTEYRFTDAAGNRLHYHLLMLRR